jgi:hypothetical protein
MWVLMRWMVGANLGLKSIKQGEARRHRTALLEHPDGHINSPATTNQYPGPLSLGQQSGKYETSTSGRARRVECPRMWSLWTLKFERSEWLGLREKGKAPNSSQSKRELQRIIYPVGLLQS